MSNISYSAVVLDRISKEKLINQLKDIIPENWEIIADHMTINLGEIDPDLVKYLGLPVRLTVNEIGINDKVIAVGVEGFKSHNPKPHITIAVNRAGGGKPMMSNLITNWEKIRRPFTITGKVTEVEFV